MGDRLRLRAFVSSPGDVSEERALAEQVLKRLGEEYRDWVELGIVLWEHEPLFVHAGFQEQIPRPSHCDLVVTVLWSRLGTRLPANFALTPGEPAPTGTEFEVRDALEARKRSGKPDLLLYRKMTAPLVNLKSADAEDYLRQYQMLNEFCGRLLVDEPGKLAAHFEFREGWEFERMLSEHTRKWLESKIGHSEAKPSWTVGSPYRGLEVFEAQHRKIYFGRSQAVSELIKRLREGESRASESQVVTRFLLLQGMSGSGKSSLIRAGLLPLLEGRALEGIGAWRQVILKPSDQPSSKQSYGALGALAEHLLAVLPRLSEAYTEATLAERLRTAPTESASLLEDYLSEEASRLTLRAHQIRLVLVVDQLEECWNPAMSEIERCALASCLSAMAREGRIWIIATLRSDFIPHLEASAETLALLRDGKLYVLSTPRPDELAQMIRAPAEAAGLAWEVKEGVSLDQAVLREATSSPESLPLLEYALDQLYEHRDGRTLTYAAYDRLGRLAGGIAASAEAILDEHGPPAKDALPRLLRSLVSVDESGQATRRYAPLEELSEGMPERSLLDRLVSRRLCVTDNLADRAVVCLAHDSLLRSWPRLTDWLQDEMSLLQTRELAQRESRLWAEHAHSDSWLAASDKVVGFKALEAAGIPLSEEVRTFIDRSERHVRRAVRIRRMAIAAIALLAVAASASAWLASRKEREAQNQAAQAHKAQLQLLTEAAAERLKDGNLIVARGIILEVLARQPASTPSDPAAVNVLQEIRATDQESAILAAHGAVRRVAYSSDGSRIVTAGLDGTARVFDARTGVQMRILRVETPVIGAAGWMVAVKTAVFSPDGTRILTASLAGTLRIWDAHTGALLTEVQNLGGLESAAYSPDGTRIVTAAGDLGWRIWSAQTGEPLSSYRGPGEKFASAVFSPDGRQIVTAGDDGKARAWDARSGSQLKVFNGHDAGIITASYAPNGERIVTASGDSTARVWDAHSGAELLKLSGHSGEVGFAVYSPDGKSIATVGVDTTIRIWDAVTGEQSKLLSGHTAIIRSAAWSPDGRYLVTGSWDSTARVWDLREGAGALVLSGHTGRVDSVSFSPDGTKLLTASDDNTSRLWATRSGTPLNMPHIEGAGAYLPDGKRIVTLVDNVIRIWDARSGSPLLSIPGLQEVYSVDFSPDGTRMLAGFSNDKGFCFGTYDATTGRSIAFAQSVHADIILDALYSPNGSRIASVAVDGTARIWDAQKLILLSVLRAKDDFRAVAWSPDGTSIVTADGSVARIWDARTSHELRVLAGHHATITSVAFSKDGRQIATGSRDGTIRLWDSRTGEQLVVLAGHRDRVLGVSYSPDGVHIASASADHTARIWDSRVPIDWPSQILWEQAVEANSLGEMQSTLRGIPSTMATLADSVLQASGKGLAERSEGTSPDGSCSALTAAYYDPDRLTPGIEQSRITADPAISACQAEADRSASSGSHLYLVGRALLARADYLGARQKFEAALAKGYRAAGVDLGLLLMDPAAKMLDPKRALTHFEQAWKSGVLIAGTEIGALYEHGITTQESSGTTFNTDASRAWSWYQAAAQRSEPTALARLGERAEFDALTGAPARMNARLMVAFTYYARAAELAHAQGWPNNVWGSWRYRRSTLARVLTKEGMTQQVLDNYKRDRNEKN